MKGGLSEGRAEGGAEKQLNREGVQGEAGEGAERVGGGGRIQRYDRRGVTGVQEEEVRGGGGVKEIRGGKVKEFEVEGTRP